ncbi:7-methylxanthosine synthase [Bertholletia excelsa]
MEVLQNIPLMNAGDGETSYANNSVHQKTIIFNMRPLLEEALKKAYNQSFPKCFKVADLGCSSGPNTFMVISMIIETIRSSSLQNNRKPPELLAYLNDLPYNDFNTVFKMLPAFYQRLKKENRQETMIPFVSAMPGSFYTRLFPSNSLHFVHSSYSLHWLSQVRLFD